MTREERRAIVKQAAERVLPGIAAVLAADAAIAKAAGPKPKLAQSHTPGPWEVGGPYPSVSVIVCVDPGHGGHGGATNPEPPQYEAICMLDRRTEGKPNEQALADAALISAAPDLLAACEALLVMMNRGGQPEKLDDALTWRENDDMARRLATNAIKKARGE